MWLQTSDMHEDMRADALDAVQTAIDTKPTFEARPRLAIHTDVSNWSPKLGAPSRALNDTLRPQGSRRVDPGKEIEWGWVFLGSNASRQHGQPRRQGLDARLCVSPHQQYWQRMPPKKSHLHEFALQLIGDKIRNGPSVSVHCSLGHSDLCL